MGTRITDFWSEKDLAPTERVKRLMQSIRGYVCEMDNHHSMEITHRLFEGLAFLHPLSNQMADGVGDMSAFSVLHTQQKVIRGILNRKRHACVLVKTKTGTVLLSPEFFEQTGTLLALSFSCSAELLEGLFRVMARDRLAAVVDARDSASDAADTDCNRFDNEQIASLVQLFDLVANVRDPLMPEEIRAASLSAIFGFEEKDGPVCKLPYTEDREELARSICEWIYHRQNRKENEVNHEKI